MKITQIDPFSLDLKSFRRKSKFFGMRFFWYVKKYRQVFLLGAILLFSIVYILFITAPFDFPVGRTVNIPEGSTLNEVAENFKRENIIRSQNVFKAFVLLQSGQRGVIAGDYFFSRPESVFGASRTVVTGDYGLTPLSVTIPEGATVIEMALIYEKHLGGFDAEKFVDLALPFEGYLFPDTYFFLPNVTEEGIIKVMKDNFVEKVSEIQEEIDAFGKTLEEVVIMASLLEEEARKFETRRMIAGILWNRISVGMRLQVDAVFPYIIGKNTFEVTLDDLAFDSPYNTYKYPGLPYGPISNPGLSSLRAAVSPIDNNYVFYLSDFDGNMHYAETFEEHKRNKNRYLK